MPSGDWPHRASKITYITSSKLTKLPTRATLSFMNHMTSSITTKTSHLSV